MRVDGGWNRVSSILLVLWVALLGLDRVDFLGGEGPFLLTPFLLLTPLLIGFEVFRWAGSRERVRLRATGAWYLLSLLLFLGVVLLSTFLARDLLMSAKRFALLGFISLGTLAVAAVVSGREGTVRALVLGAKVGLGITLLFALLEGMAFWVGLTDPVRLGFVSVNLWPHTYYGILPRISGPVLDANRGGLLMVFYLFVLLRWGRSGPGRAGWVLLGALMIVLSLSRSALLAGGIVALVAWVDGREVVVSRRVALAGLAILALGSGWLLASPASREGLARTLSPLAQRLSPMESSTREHFYLLGRGVEEGTGSVKRAVIGLGYGNAYLVLQDVFPGNKYGNFHSLYVTMLAESGVLALILSLVLLLSPLLLPGPFRPLVAGFVFFNLFYQTLAEPLFWFALALAWLTMVSRGGRPVRHEDAPVIRRSPT